MAPASAWQPATLGRRLVQLTLDFLAPASPELPAGNGKLSDLASKRHSPPVDIASDAIENVAIETLPAPAAFCHPRATRDILLAGRRVAYEVRRRKRRTIGFSVGSDGLTVSAPQWVPLHEIDAAVRGKSGWILQKLQDTQARHRQLESAQVQWQDGAVFLWMGEPVRLVLDADAPASEACGLPGARSLCLKLRADAAPADIQRAVQAWLRQQATVLFTERLDFFAPQLSVQWRTMALSSASTRWGSASSSGAIRLNWRLIHLDPALIDYVVVHELSHLRHMDHSPRFWATVQSILPTHVALRRRLRNEALPRR